MPPSIGRLAVIVLVAGLAILIAGNIISYSKFVRRLQAGADRLSIRLVDKAPSEYVNRIAKHLPPGAQIVVAHPLEPNPFPDGGTGLRVTIRANWSPWWNWHRFPATVSATSYRREGVQTLIR